MSDEPVRRPKEKQSSRAGNVELSDMAMDKNATPEEIQQIFDDLRERADPGIQKHIEAIKNSEVDERDVVLFIMDGTSPLAKRRPVDVVLHGRKSQVVILAKRSDIIAMNLPIIDRQRDLLSKPASCGHLWFFISTNLGSIIECRRCGVIRYSDEEPS